MFKHTLLALMSCMALDMGTTNAASPLAELVADNPDIAAAGARTDAADDELDAARGGRLPQIRVEGSIGAIDQSFSLPVDGVDQTFGQGTEPRSVRATLEQAIFTSGVLSGAINAAEASSAAASATEKATRQEVTLAGATAIADIVEARGTLDVRFQNECIISQRLEETQSRLAAGLATKTDLLQSESRLAAATAERILAEGRLASTEEAYVRVFGKPPAHSLTLPTLPSELPVDLEEAVQLTEKIGPILQAERKNAEAASFAVREARGRTLPQISISGEAAYAENQNVAQFLGDTERYGVFLNVRMDLFAGGTNRARTRAAKNRARAAKYLLEAQRRQVRQSMIEAWAERRAAVAALEARTRQVVAAEQSRDGVLREAEANRRTRLDVLDAELELANARVDRLSAERNAIVSGFAILALIGNL